MIDDNGGFGGPIATARWADPDYIENKYFYRPGDIWIGRNPHDYTSAIGYRDDRHIVICAGAGSGKGRSFIINNLALWPGSTVVYDPKGELPEITAARRGRGDTNCIGLDQDVFVLDPLNHCDVDPQYRAYFDPLQALDPEDGELQTWTKRIANSLIKVPEGGGESTQWAKRAMRFVALIITHVVTSGHFKERDRNLHTVLRLVVSGVADEIAERQKRYGDAPPENQGAFDPFELFFEMMEENTSCRGWISREATSIKRQMLKTPKYYESVRGEAADQLDWMKSENMELSMTGRIGDSKIFGADRAFDPKRLKTDPKGISVYIVMPTDDLDTYEPWVQTMFVGVFAAMRRVKGKPKAGPVLGILDEFSSLGYQDYIATSLDNIRGAGMKLAIIVQNFGTLKKTYGEKMESFFTNAGLELYFGRVGSTALEYITKEIGDTEVVRIARSRTETHSESGTETKGHSFGETSTEGGSETFTESESRAKSRSRGWNWSNGVNWSDSDNWGQSDGKNMGVNYGPHVFWRGLSKSTNYGSSLSRNKGGSHTKGGNRAKGGNRSESTTNTNSSSHSRGSSWSTSTTTTKSYSSAQTEGYSIAGGFAETFHKKPLLESHEFNSYLAAVPESERDHPAYPGFALVRILGEAPFFVRRSNYDQDPYFVECFTPDRSFKYIPLNRQPMLGYQYTEQHILPMKLPKILLEHDYETDPEVRPHTRVKAGQILFRLSPGDIPIPAPTDGRVLEFSSPEAQKEGAPAVAVRSDSPLDKPGRLAFSKEVYGPSVRAVRDAINRREIAEREAEADRARQAEIAAELAALRREKYVREQTRDDPIRRIVNWFTGQN